MALPFPEGKGFFGGESLRSEGDYNANDSKDFYNYFIIENLWNVEADIDPVWTCHPDGWTHPRSAYHIVKEPKTKTLFGNWAHLPISYGPTGTEIKRITKHNLCLNGNRRAVEREMRLRLVSIVAFHAPHTDVGRRGSCIYPCPQRKNGGSGLMLVTMSFSLASTDFCSCLLVSVVSTFI